VPHEELPRLRQLRPPDPDEVAAAEARTHHDVTAFLQVVGAQAPQAARYLHLGLTSSDVVDTALAVQLGEALAEVVAGVDRLEAVVAGLARRYRETPEVGRTHGMHAEPITFGLKCAVWLAELRRQQRRLELARQDMAVGRLAGTVGTHATIDPRVEEHVCAALGLRPAEAVTQVLQRDRHAFLVSCLAVLSGSLEKIATEVRHLQRSEVSEAREPFHEGQAGSSAMPHKRNPILCERVCGLSRLMRGYALAAMENQALWHERDISHSSSERVLLADATTLVDYQLATLEEVLEGLEVDEAAMARNLDMGGGVTSSHRVLLALVEAGLSRQAAYELVQEHALAALSDREGPGFRERLEGDPEVQKALGEGRATELSQPEIPLEGVAVTFSRLGLT
jgi:adenylosuccinate lyase